VNQLEELLKMCDKDLYVSYRDGNITFKQFQARIFERRGARKFVVLDDMKPDLDNSIKEMLVQ